jgi:hypothetical protein
MRSPQNYGSGLYFCHMSPYMSHSHITQPHHPNHQDITWSPTWCFLPWFVHKTHIVAEVPVFRALLPALSRNSGIRIHSQIWKIVTIGWTSGLLQPGSRTHLPGEGPGPLFPRQNVISRVSAQIVGINNTSVLKTDTQETENLDKAISLDQEGASMCSLPLSKHTSTK